MSCVPLCLSEGEGASIPLEDFDRWTDSLIHVLESRDARRYFGEFLSTRELEESEAALEFWERCEVLSRAPHQHSHTHHHHHHGHHNHRTGNVSNMRFLKNAQDLVTFAEDKVNLDLAALRALYDAVQSGADEQIRCAAREAMQSAAELMQDDYQLFRKHLLKQRGLSSAKH